MKLHSRNAKRSSDWSNNADPHQLPFLHFIIDLLAVFDLLDNGRNVGLEIADFANNFVHAPTRLTHDLSGSYDRLSLHLPIFIVSPGSQPGKPVF